MLELVEITYQLGKYDNNMPIITPCAYGHSYYGSYIETDNRWRIQRGHRYNPLLCITIYDFSFEDTMQRRLPQKMTPPLTGRYHILCTNARSGILCERSSWVPDDDMVPDDASHTGAENAVEVTLPFPGLDILRHRLVKLVVNMNLVYNYSFDVLQTSEWGQTTLRCECLRGLSPRRLDDEMPPDDMSGPDPDLLPETSHLDSILVRMWKTTITTGENAESIYILFFGVLQAMEIPDGKSVEPCRLSSCSSQAVNGDSNSPRLLTQMMPSTRSARTRNREWQYLDAKETTLADIYNLYCMDIFEYCKYVHIVLFLGVNGPNARYTCVNEKYVYYMYCPMFLENILTAILTHTLDIYLCICGEVFNDFYLILILNMFREDYAHSGTDVYYCYISSCVCSVAASPIHKVVTVYDHILIAIECAISSDRMFQSASFQENCVMPGMGRRGDPELCTHRPKKMTNCSRAPKRHMMQQDGLHHLKYYEKVGCVFSLLAILASACKWQMCRFYIKNERSPAEILQVFSYQPRYISIRYVGIEDSSVMIYLYLNGQIDYAHFCNVTVTYSILICAETQCHLYFLLHNDPNDGLYGENHAGSPTRATTSTAAPRDAGQPYTAAKSLTPTQIDTSQTPEEYWLDAGSSRMYSNVVVQCRCSVLCEPCSMLGVLQPLDSKAQYLSKRLLINELRNGPLYQIYYLMYATSHNMLLGDSPVICDDRETVNTKNTICQ